MIQITETRYNFEVNFAFRPHLVEEIKTINGRRFDPVKKNWIIPIDSREALTEWAAKYGTKIGNDAPTASFDIPALPELETSIPLRLNPFPYQKSGIAYCLQKERLIIGDQPGLGKTGQAIAAILGNNRFPALIIFPATIKENWKREVEKWTDKKAMILNDRVKSTWHTYWKVGMIDIFIVNYESLKKYFVESINTPAGKPLRLDHIKFKETINLFQAIVIDESHRCKDGSTQQSKFCMGISRNKPMVLALTGTPVVNKPKDLISQLYIIGQLNAVFGGYKAFTDRFCQGPREASNLKELNYVLNMNCFYRREKKEVLKDLPDKMRQIVKTEITNRADYQKAESDLRKYLKENLKKT